MESAGVAVAGCISVLVDNDMAANAGEGMTQTPILFTAKQLDVIVAALAAYPGTIRGSGDDAVTANRERAKARITCSDITVKIKRAKAQSLPGKSDSEGLVR